MSITAAQMVQDANALIETIAVTDAFVEIKSGDVIVLDVREPIEWSEYIEGAVQIPRGTLEFVADPASPRHNPALDPSKRLLVVCRSGGRAALAAATLKALGFTNVANVAGGMNAWKDAHLPTADAHAGL
jgi:rhodanese-related sulfurtransferase